MKTFPMFLRMEDRRVVIVGGGEQAAQKCRLMLKTEARIVVAAPSLDEELAALAHQGRIEWHAGAVTPALFADTALVFIATGCAGADAALHGLAREAGATVNVVDAPDLCDALTPSIVDRDPVVVAIGTEGTAPVLARQIKTRVEEILEPRLGDLASLAGRLRDAVARRVPREKRRAFWRWVFSASPRQSHARGAERQTAQAIKQAIEQGAAPETREGGFVSLVGAGPGSRDLITLRGVQRLQEADIIFYDRLVDPDVLEYARRDAERVYVGKVPGAHVWPQERINSVLVAAARRGQRVVRLKCGDPGIFARGREEVNALEEAGLPFEIVPGVTAACAASAAAGSFLTERGSTDTLVLSTGTSRVGASSPDWAAHLREGTTLALYMPVCSVGEIQRNLLKAGMSSHLPVEIVASAATPRERIVRCELGTLSTSVAKHRIESPAMILIRRPEDRSVGASHSAAA